MKNYLREYLNNISSNDFRKDKHEKFFWTQFLMTVACCILNGAWVIKDVFIKGIGPEGSLVATVICRLLPLVLLVPFTIISIKWNDVRKYHLPNTKYPFFGCPNRWYRKYDNEPGNLYVTLCLCVRNKSNCGSNIISYIIIFVFTKLFWFLLC